MSENERDELLKKCPQAEKYIKQFLGAEEFIHNKKRFCLWLVDCPPNEIRQMKPIYERVKKVADFRKNSKKIPTQKAAEIPHLFTENRQPTSNYILVPRVSSEKRKYVPMDFVSPEIICGDANLMIPDAEVWHFGILTSSVHMAWMRLVCGRLTSRYRYSAKIVYNNFPWMRMEFLQYAKLILAAKNILDTRKNYPDASFADLYDEVTMPKDLREAHKNLDKIVLGIYGYDEKISEEDMQIDLLFRYKEIADYRAAHPKKKFKDENFDDE